MPDIFYNRDQMWFGTEEKQGFIETPQTGAEVSPDGFGAVGKYQNGGSFVRNSWDSHKVYQFSWGDSAPLSLASKIMSYANGSYGRGRIYFHDPMYYQTNILPKRWADPSMAINFEAAPLIPDVWPTSATTAANSNELPVYSAVYPVVAGYSSQTLADELYIPIPTGFTLRIGAVYSSTNAACNLYYRTPGGTTTITATVATATNLMPQSVTAQPWARIGIRNTGGSPYSLTAAGMMFRLIPPGEASDSDAPWMAGEGHSGCEFEGKPTLINYAGTGGGQVGLACSLRETGAWV